MNERLAKEISPYLREHAKDPVEWYPWCDEAFEKAKREEKPLMVSIGYSSCHWCHVMQRESFSDTKTAEILNEKFVCIKVDKEERPDIDAYFQEIFTTMNGRSGGWPLTIFITHDKIPLYSATYIPADEAYGMLPLTKLLELISTRYEKERESMLKKGMEVLKFLLPAREIEATVIDERLETTAISQIKSTYDRNGGGFGSAPKFPRSSTLSLALTLYRISGDDELLSIVTDSVRKMCRGGFYDIVEGGFCRYSTDDDWLVPHFEKMTYDNALMADVLLDIYHATKSGEYRDIAFQTLDFLIGKMMEENLFSSASDADSSDREGGYYLYDYEETLEAFENSGVENPVESAKSLSITPEGNFSGLCIARVDDRTKLKNLTHALEVLSSSREGREPPRIDDKVICSVNAMAIKALFKAGRVETRYLTKAIESLDALLKLLKPNGRLYHSGIRGEEPKGESYLEDYGWLGLAFVEAYRSTLDEEYLDRAVETANEAIRRFYAGGRWRISDGEFGIFADDLDRGVPSPVAVIVTLLQDIQTLSDPVYGKFVFKSLEVSSYELTRRPIQRAMMTSSALRDRGERFVVASKYEKLHPYIGYRDLSPVPWLEFSVNGDEKYTLCGKESCFAEAENFEDIWIRIVEKWDKA